MPYKTKSGSHYHMTMGCHGATIPCDTTGLEPCSDCCGAGNGDSGGRGIGDATSGIGAGSSGSQEREYGHMSEEGADSPTLGEESHATDVILAIPPDADGMTMSMPEAPDDIDEAEFQRCLAEYASMFSDGDIYVWSGLEATPALPRDSIERKIPQPDGNGRMTWDPQANLTDGEIRAIESGNERARKLARTLRKRGVDRGDESDAKVSFVLRIEEDAGKFPDSGERELMRLSAQRTWNAMHPESPVLEWSRASDAYADDSPLAVMHALGVWDEDTRYVTYTLHSKSNGEDITARVANVTGRMQSNQDEMTRILDEGRERARDEETRRERRMFSDWLSMASGRRRRYMAASPDAKRKMMRQCWEFWDYRRRPAIPHLTEEEAERLHQLQDDQKGDQRILDGIIRQYGLTDDMIRLAGRTTDEVFRRRAT